MPPEVEREIVAWLEKPAGTREKVQDALEWVFFVLWFLSFGVIWFYGQIVESTGAVVGNFWFSLAFASFGFGVLQACNEWIRLGLYLFSFKRIVRRLDKGVSITDAIGVVKRWLYTRGNKERLSSWFKILAVKWVDPQKRALYWYAQGRVLYDESPVPEQCYSCCTQHGLTEVPLESLNPESRKIKVCTNCQAALGSSGVGEGFWGFLHNFCFLVGFIVGLLSLIVAGGLRFQMFGGEISFFYLCLIVVVLSFLLLASISKASPGAEEMKCWLGVNDYMAFRRDGYYEIQFKNKHYAELLPAHPAPSFDKQGGYKSKS